MPTTKVKCIGEISLRNRGASFTFIRISKTEQQERHRRRTYGRLLSGIEASMTRGYKILRKNKWSYLVRHTPCIQFITLTSSEESPDDINYFWKIALRKIRKDYKDFQYAKIRTDEGVKGVLHIICRAREFIPKAYLSKVWGDTFQAPVTWNTQAYGNKRTLLKYLLRYFGHHTRYSYGASLNWIFKGFSKEMRRIFLKYDYKTAKFAWYSKLKGEELINDGLSAIV